jgi:hypothetical protein
VDAAYAMLAGEGYVVSRGPAGTIVSEENALRMIRRLECTIGKYL